MTPRLQELQQYTPNGAYTYGYEMAMEDMKPALDAARTIFTVVDSSFSVSRDVLCPHGNAPYYPAHGKWCDACWQALEDALAGLEAQDY